MNDKNVTQQFVLTRRQIEKLYEISNQLKDVDWFTLEKSNGSGIGPAVIVKFKIFKEKEQDTDAVVDITDYKTW